MLSSLRTYRPVAALLVAALLLSGNLPLVHHACAALSEGFEMVFAMCCCEDGDQEAPRAHDPAAHSEAPCHDAGSRPIHASHPAPWLATDAGTSCCMVEVVQARRDDFVVSEQTSSLRLQVAALQLLVVRSAADVQQAPVQPPERAFRASPPLSLHLLHGSFLN